MERAAWMEKRKHARANIDLPVLFAVAGADSHGEGIGKDISIGGMFIETTHAGGFGASVVVRVRLKTPAGEQDFDLPGTVRWVRNGGMGVQFGLLGALETHAITELAKLSDGA